MVIGVRNGSAASSDRILRLDPGLLACGVEVVVVVAVVLMLLLVLSFVGVVAPAAVFWRWRLEVPLPTSTDGCLFVQQQCRFNNVRGRRGLYISLRPRKN